MFFVCRVTTFSTCCFSYIIIDMHDCAPTGGTSCWQDFVLSAIQFLHVAVEKGCIMDISCVPERFKVRSFFGRRYHCLQPFNAWSLWRSQLRSLFICCAYHVHGGTFEWHPFVFTHSPSLPALCGRAFGVNILHQFFLVPPDSSFWAVGVTPLWSASHRCTPRII